MSAATLLHAAWIAALLFAHLAAVVVARRLEARELRNRRFFKARKGWIFMGVRRG